MHRKKLLKMKCTNQILSQPVKFEKSVFSLDAHLAAENETRTRSQPRPHSSATIAVAVCPLKSDLLKSSEGRNCSSKSPDMKQMSVLQTSPS